MRNAPENESGKLSSKAQEYMNEVDALIKNPEFARQFQKFRERLFRRDAIHFLTDEYLHDEAESEDSDIQLLIFFAHRIYSHASYLLDSLVDRLDQFEENVTYGEKFPLMLQAKNLLNQIAEDPEWGSDDGLFTVRQRLRLFRCESIVLDELSDSAANMLNQLNNTPKEIEAITAAVQTAIPRH